MAEPTEPRLSPNALTTVERARSYLQQKGPREDFELAEAIEFATAALEVETRRRLAERWYRANVTRAGLTLGADSATVTGGTDFSTALAVAMDVFYAGGSLRWGSRIASIASNASLDLTLPATTAVVGTASLTFGSVDGPQEWEHGGGRKIMLLEYPVAEVLSVETVGLDGQVTPLSLTNSLLRRKSGVLIMADEIPGRGDMLRVAFRAGYRRPTLQDREHEQEWKRLEHLCLRCVQVFWQDYRHEIGRSVELNMREQLLRFTSLKLPEDIRDGIASFAREEL
jgi:hypothetical protein